MLAPQFIAKVPHDPIGAQPLHYRTANDGQFILYSVGWNEKDDGGIVSLNKSGSVDLGNGDWAGGTQVHRNRESGTRNEDIGRRCARWVRYLELLQRQVYLHPHSIL